MVKINGSLTSLLLSSCKTLGKLFLTTNPFIRERKTKMKKR